MPITIGEGLSFCGRALTGSELDLIRSISHDFRCLTVTELAATVCELLQWRRPNGALKTRECFLFLRELQRRGWLPDLPAPQPRQRAPLAKLTSAPGPCPGPARRFPVLLSANHAATDPERCRSPPLSGISGALSLPGLPRSLRCTTPLLGTVRAPATATLGRLVVHQCR